jgi:hypothetical protein
LREIVTLFSSLPFTSEHEIFVITEENFFIFFIATIVAFFLLGAIIGYIRNPYRRLLKKTKEKPPKAVADSKQEPPNPYGQDNLKYQDEGQGKMDNQPQRYGNNYYNRWDYSNPRRRY